MQLILFVPLMMLFTIGNIDPSIPKCNPLNKKRKRNLAKRTLSTSKNFQMLTEFTIKRTGLNQISVAKT